jgi:hypothetical protein
VVTDTVCTLWQRRLQLMMSFQGFPTSLKLTRALEYFYFEMYGNQHINRFINLAKKDQQSDAFTSQAIQHTITSNCSRDETQIFLILSFSYGFTGFQKSKSKSEAASVRGSSGSRIVVCLLVHLDV